MLPALIFTFGKQSGVLASDAFTGLEVIETIALSPALTPIEPGLLSKHFKRKHGPGADYGQSNVLKSPPLIGELRQEWVHLSDDSFDVKIHTHQRMPSLW